jgi:DNA-binding FrmR family transcriptional regulator
MPHTNRDRDKLKARLARIRGQIDAVARALDEQQDCGEVLQQIAAVRGAVTGLLGEVLEWHVREHLAGQGLTADDRRIAADELIEVLRRYFR